MNLGRLDDVVELSKTLSIPVWPAYLIVSLGLLFMGLFVFIDLRRVKKGTSGLFKEESPDELVMS